ncbi:MULTISPECIES: transcriptional regulator [unclassified Bradyrhizobium]|uniref:transcriptional regulator n=1 Tax=unclassified Bradyrhizobium TaxID=2631580 RepID=UPI001BA64C1F|nr:MULTISPECIES: transcriptional regulator [unclassified Bradyrhizobium]MBR1204478.1 transcriptional regulator [Bradyrhizobium sp. AUGA SZCCT0124]MBR1309636.1 transcriptional regulator [Bradyrhizobium sp. AUGA SZCCT0051]MBR1339777.1 transcriptional regulator [Bradyrhizobium sp. AUGA SZCCT0105]MBR1354384.1 transcriptional regulator [Bradyrhizobium sp. AUGA SZCCT0045]
MPKDEKIQVEFGFSPVEVSHPHMKQFLEFLEDFNKETERGTALAATAFIDDLLERTLVAFLIPNDSGQALTSGFNAPLGTFAARIAACHAMGLISESEFKECQILRKVRNEFAHRVRMSFDDPKVKGLCSGLTLFGEWEDGQPLLPRVKFSMSAIAIIMNLTNRPYHVGQQALKYRDWKR